MQENEPEALLNIPIATVDHTESYALEERDYSLNELNSILISADEAYKKSNQGGYDKTGITIKYPFDGENQEYTLRYDIGDMDGGLIVHIRDHWAYLKKDNVYNVSDEQIAHVENFLLPYLSEHIEEERHTAINYKITDDNLGVGGPKEKFWRNIDAIRKKHRKRR